VVCLSVSVCSSRSGALQKRLNRSRCSLVDVQMGPRNHVSDEVQIAQREGAIYFWKSLVFGLVLKSTSYAVLYAAKKINNGITFTAPLCVHCCSELQCCRVPTGSHRITLSPVKNPPMHLRCGLSSKSFDHLFIIAVRQS